MAVQSSPLDVTAKDASPPQPFGALRSTVATAVAAVVSAAAAFRDAAEAVPISVQEAAQQRHVEEERLETSFFDGVRSRASPSLLSLAAMSAAPLAIPIKSSLTAFFSNLRANPTFMSALIAWALAQILKVFTNLYFKKTFDIRMVVSSGGMPSSHTALCVAVTTSVALLHGVGGPLFPICLAFSSIIMYDATNVRYHAGVQAEVRASLDVQSLQQQRCVPEGWVELHCMLFIAAAEQTASAPPFICPAFSLSIMYDATNVRYHAGVQAEVLNVVVEEMLEGHPISEKKLKELLGHTPLQVVGGFILGTPHPPSPPPFLALLIPAPLAPHPSPSLYHAHSTSLSPISRLPPPISLPPISLPPISLSPQSPPTSHRCISIGRRGTRDLHQPPPLPSPLSPLPSPSPLFPTSLPLPAPLPTSHLCMHFHQDDVGPVNCINRALRPSLSWLGYHWRPATCQVPAYGFRPYHFLKMMRNRVIASVGDSLSYQNLMPSLLCHIHGASPVTEIPNDGSLAIQHKRSRVYRVEVYNVTLINTWSTFLNEYWQDEQTLSRYSSGKNRTDEDSVINLDGVDPALTARVTKYDVLILQTAAHWQAKPNKWRRYFVDGQGRLVFTERQYIAAFEPSNQAIVTLLHLSDPDTSPAARTPVPFFRSAPAPSFSPPP
ncbi:unnamed protein product [Closterium sp. NIES-64]|nr:unnamed protein product [Closterium sp. NIES-64]